MPDDPYHYAYRYRTRLTAMRIEPNQGFARYVPFERDIEFLFTYPELMRADGIVPGEGYAALDIEVWLDEHIRHRDVSDVIRTNAESGGLLAAYLMRVFGPFWDTLESITVSTVDGRQSWTAQVHP